MKPPLTSTPPASLSDRHLTLSDIALLAQVRRPVVTVWRTRHGASSYPFPGAALTLDGQELFACEDVVAWLEATRRGNNRDPRADAIAFTMTTAEAALELTAFLGLSALLCLHVINAGLPDKADDLLDLADACDSDDTFLYREIEALGDRLEPTARYAALLAAAAYGSAAPFEQLLQHRAKAQGQPFRSLSDDLRALVADTAIGLADQGGFTEPVFVVTSVDDVELLIEIAARTEGRGAIQAAISTNEEPALRQGRRRLRAHDIAYVELDADDGAIKLPPQAVVVMGLPSGTDDLTSLTDVSPVALNLTHGQRAVVVGQSTALTDALRDVDRGPGRRPAGDNTMSEAAVVRRDVIKTGFLRAVVRLPQGGLPARARARAALWCLGPSSESPTRASAEYTLCADVTAALIPSVREDLVTDLVASMGGPVSAREHSLTWGRFAPSSQLQLADGDLVRPTPPRRAVVAAVEAVQEIDRLLDQVSAPWPAWDPPRVVATAQRGTPTTITLGDAVGRRRLRWISGARVNADDLVAGEGIPVVTDPDDLNRPGGAPAAMDRAWHVTRYSHTELTLPGDIVVTTAPRPRAQVDHDGGKLVAFPARILRCHKPGPEPPEGPSKKQDPQTCVPEAVAADINALPATATGWQAWPISDIPTGQIAALAAILEAVAEQRRHAMIRLGVFDDLTTALARGVSSSTCALEQSEGR